MSSVTARPRQDQESSTHLSYTTNKATGKEEHNQSDMRTSSNILSHTTSNPGGPIGNSSKVSNSQNPETIHPTTAHPTDSNKETVRGPNGGNTRTSTKTIPGGVTSNAKELTKILNNSPTKTNSGTVSRENESNKPSTSSSHTSNSRDSNPRDVTSNPRAATKNQSMESNKPPGRTIAGVNDTTTAHRTTIPPSGRSSSQSGRGDNNNDGSTKPRGATNSPVMESIKSSGGSFTSKGQPISVRSELNPSTVSRHPSESGSNSNVLSRKTSHSDDATSGPYKVSNSQSHKTIHPTTAHPTNSNKETVRSPDGGITHTSTRTISGGVTSDVNGITKIPNNSPTISKTGTVRLK